MNKLLSIEEEKKFLIDFFHSEFCQYKVEKTDEFGDKFCDFDDNAYRCLYSSDIFEGDKLQVSSRYNRDENGKIICELIFTKYSWSKKGISSPFGRLVFLAPDNERYCFDGDIISIMPVSNYYQIDILFRISEEIAGLVFAVGSKVRIKLFDSVDCKITHYGCSLLDWYRLVVENVHLSEDRIDALYDILVVCSEKRKAALLYDIVCSVKRNAELEERKKQERIRQEQEREQKRARQEREREIKLSEKAELTPLLRAIQQSDWKDFSFIKTLVKSPYSIPSVVALSEYCKRRGKKHPFLKEVEYCQTSSYPDFLKGINQRQRKRIVNRSLLYLLISYVFVGVVYPNYDGVPELLGLVMALSYLVFIGLGIYSFSIDCPKKGLPEEEIEILKKALTITDLDYNWTIGSRIFY